MRHSTGACTLVAFVIATSPAAGQCDPPGGVIQAAICDAVDGDEIVVPPGVYTEAIDFLGKRITLRSEAGPFETTIDASGLGVTGVSMATSDGDGGGLEARLDGFTITGGDGEFGGGVYVSGTGAATIGNCIIEGNDANFGGGIFVGAGSAALIFNTLIVGNAATGFGSAVFANQSDPVLAGCTITGNDAPPGRGVLFSVASLVDVTNSIIHGNVPAGILGVSVEIESSDVEGGWPGNNIDLDPMFIDPKSGDYRPAMLSPCTDAGDNGLVPSGVDLDLRGNDRIVASDAKSLVVDIGAIEYQGVEDGDPLPPIIIDAPPDTIVLVRPGTYEGPIDFGGKSVTLISTDGPESATIVPPKGGGGPLVLFTAGEGVNAVLNGFTVAGGSAPRGGGVLIDGADPTILNCIFRNNTATEAGGAIAIRNGRPDIVNCVFLQNAVTSSADGGLFGGGAIVNENSAPRITNCTFLENDGVEQGGAILSDSASAPVVVSSILWDNMPDQISGGAFAVSYSDVQGSKGSGPGNIDVDPLIVDEYRLDDFSPCIDAGDTTAFPSNVFTDLLGQPRFFDDPDTKDAGKGAPPIDMGAFEYQVAPPPPPCPEDIDGNGDVGFAEIIAVLAAFGPCDGCPEDIDGDGDVGFSDILLILGAWGPCPGRLGACCLFDGSCFDSTEEDCAGQDGSFRGLGTACATEQCQPPP